jgi:hypothetical protein
MGCSRPPRSHTATPPAGSQREPARGPAREAPPTLATLPGDDAYDGAVLSDNYISQQR